MSGSKEIISVKTLEKFLREMEEYCRSEVVDASSKSREHGAPQSYREDMNGFARGASEVGNSIISQIRKKFVVCEN